MDQVPRTHYEVLGVAPTATPKAIRAAYRALAQLLHPDTSTEPDSHTRFSELAAAYAVLSDRVKRRAYDAALRRAPHESTPAGRSGGFQSPHFTWKNIADSQSGVNGPHPSPTDFDEMYDAYFGPQRPEQ